MSLDTIKHDLRQLIITVSNMKTLNAEDILDEQLLFDGSLGLDSIDLLELVVALQRKYGIKLKNDATGQAALSSVGALALAIETHLSTPLGGFIVTSATEALSEK